MTDQLPERIWAKRGVSTCCDGVWDEPVDPDDMDDDEAEYLRDDTAVTRAEADAMVASAFEKAADLHDWTFSDKRANQAYWQSDQIRALTPSDARAALERAVREAVEAERDRCARIVEEYAPNSSFMEDALHHIRKGPSV